MIEKFQVVDTQFAVNAVSDTISVRSGGCKSSTRSTILTVSPGRYSLGRLREDQVSARTINPNHEYYQTPEYEEQRAKTFGSLKSKPRTQDPVIPPYQEEKVPKIGKPRNVTGKITDCSRKHNQLNYKSNVPLGFNQND